MFALRAYRALRQVTALIVLAHVAAGVLRWRGVHLAPFDTIALALLGMAGVPWWVRRAIGRRVETSAVSRRGIYR